MAVADSCPSCGGLLPDGSSSCPVCVGDTMARPVSANSGFSGYKIIQQLGKGGMGAVYLAEENETKRFVAIKIMSATLSDDARGRNRFQREAQTLSTIHHPNIVQFESFGEFLNQPYIIMEYVEGETLAQRIKSKGLLSVNSALRILREIISALDAAWEKHVIHRDIKPSNILIERSGRVRVADFGLAKPAAMEGENTLTETGAVIGSPHYISPEQAEGKELDFRSDIYSLGIVLYEMLVGERPFQGETPLAIVVQHLNTPLPSPRGKQSSIPVSVVSLLHWMTRKDPAKRPSSYKELAAQIDSILEGKSNKRGFWVSLAAALALSTAVLIIFWPKQPTPAPIPVTRSIQHKPFSPVTAVAKTLEIRINVLPWARIRIIPLTKGIVIPALSEKELISPTNISIPEGEYKIELTNGSEMLSRSISVKTGEPNSFNFRMPSYDPSKAFAQIRGNH